MLISQKQHAANRSNALRSTGPVTQEGKAAVRLNALRYGLRARTILLPGENPGDFHQLCADLESDWQPHNRTEQLLVEQMAVAQWKLARLEVGERSVFAQEMPAAQQLALLDRFSVQRGRLERSFSKAVRELQNLRKAGPAYKSRQPAAEDGSVPRPAAPATSVEQPSMPEYVMSPAQAAFGT
jgi:hypothetical protein